MSQSRIFFIEYVVWFQILLASRQNAQVILQNRRSDHQRRQMKTKVRKKTEDIGSSLFVARNATHSIYDANCMERWALLKQNSLSILMDNKCSSFRFKFPFIKKVLTLHLLLK